MNVVRALKNGESPNRGKEARGDMLKYLRIAKVVRVDYETGWLDIEWTKDKKSVRQFVYMPSAYSSLRGTIKGMPEEGSYVVCGWFRGQSQTLEDPIILSFLDINLTQQLNYTLLRNANTPAKLEEIKTIREKIGYDVVRGKRRKIYPGEIQIESSPGAELYLDEDVYLSDSRLNEIEIRSADKSIRMSSNQYYSITQAARTWNGMIVREPNDQGFSFQPTVMPNGQKIQFITESNQPFHLGGKVFTEHRIEVYEKSDGILKASEVNSGYDASDFTPFITSVMGTLVGNDKTDLSRYGKVLRPQIFGDRLATDPSLDYVECSPPEYNSLASTVSLRLNSNAQIDIDKEGHLFTSFPASTGAHPLGAGRSWEASFGGSVKLVLGAEKNQNESLFVDTKGGMRLNLGFDNLGKSQITIAKKGVHLEVLDKADDGFAYFLKTKGDYKSLIDGNYNLEITGNYFLRVHGKIQEEIMGTKIQNYVNDFNNLYGGSYKKIVTKDMQEQIGYNRDAKITGNLETAPGIFAPALPTQTVDKLEVTTGCREEKYINGSLKRTLFNGNAETTITLGEIKETITTGINGVARETNITTGDNKLDITTGSDLETIVTGDIKRTVTTKKDVGISDTVTTGNIEETITTGSKKETVTTGNIEETVTTGDDKISVSTGNILQSVTLGDSKEDVGTGSKKITVKVGDFEVSVTTGNVVVQTTTGTVNIKAATQTVTINGMMSVDVISGTQVNVKAPMVNIGQSPIKGGVVTGLPMPSHYDFIVGLPLLTSQTVKAAL